jgi:hypothetical protein
VPDWSGSAKSGAFVPTVTSSAIRKAFQEG